MVEPMVRTLRRETRRRMNSDVTVDDKTGEEFDPDTGEMVETWETLYDGPALIRSSGMVGQTVEAGDAELTLHTIRVVLRDNTLVPAGARVTVNASSVDAELAGRTFWVEDYEVQDRRTWRPLTCVEGR